jgi:hypothetical protein
MEGLPRDVEDIDIVEGEAVDTQPGQAIETREAIETESTEAEPIPIDTTAELLGRRTRKPRARLPRQAAAAATVREPQGRATKKPAAKRATARRSSRSKKTAADAGGDAGE